MLTPPPTAASLVADGLDLPPGWTPADIWDTDDVIFEDGVPGSPPPSGSPFEAPFEARLDPPFDTPFESPFAAVGEPAPAPASEPAPEAAPELSPFDEAPESSPFDPPPFQPKPFEPESDPAPAPPVPQAVPQADVPAPPPAPLTPRVPVELTDARPAQAGDRDPQQARIPVFDLDRLRVWLTQDDLRLGRVAVVSVELDNLAFVQERLGSAAGAPARGDHGAAAHRDPPATSSRT
ncbi:MAG: hypothetical protein U0W40_01735 [Acidimicrobiia bacterium]